MRLLVLLLVAGLAVLALRGYLESDRRQIERQFERLAEAASVQGTESPIEQIAQAAQVARFFTNDVVLRLGQDSSSVIAGRDALVALAAQARRRGAMQVMFDDVQVSVGGPDSASVYTTVTATGANLQSEVVEAREISVTLQKVDGDWLIARVEGVRTLERP
jgi:ketosteroid isomerase-like protein